RMLWIGLLSGGYGEDELMRAGAFRVCRDPAELHASLDGARSAAMTGAVTPGTRHPTEPLIRNISDTARWVATYRARETARPNALFHDPFAKRLAGERGEQIAAAMPNVSGTDWPFVIRTYLFDRYIAAAIERGVDTVLNLAAGLDARPYRMALPASLTWIEVDLPGLLSYK